MVSTGTWGAAMRRCGAVATWRIATALLAAVLLAAALPPGARARPSAESSLAVVSSHLRAALALSAPGPQLAPTLPALRLGADEAVVELRFTALTPAVAARAEAHGARILRASYRYARLVARAPLTALADLAALPRVTAIHPLYGAHQATGSVESQAVRSHRVDEARGRFGVDGSGLKLGILSDSFSTFRGGTYSGSGCQRVITGSSPQASGDLPAEVVVLDPGPRGGIDEGSGMAELVHDLAPGAALLFASAFPDEATFAENITALRACGADVLTDDILFFAEPMFQPGIITQAAAAAVANGALFFTAAANLGDGGIDQFYRDAAAEDDEADRPTGADLHDFGAGDRFAAITIPPRCGVRLVLQWNEPFSGTLGAGAATDLDLYLYDAESPDSLLLAAAADTQGCATKSGRAGDPFEILLFRNDGSEPRTVHAAVDHFCGDESVRFRLVAIGAQCLPGLAPYAFEPGLFGAPAIYGHAAAPEIATVAAADYREIDSGGTFAPPADRLDVEGFSARGGWVPLYFDAAGNRLSDSPQLVFKPDFTAADGTDTAFFGMDIDANGFPNFIGTSAAAPHAAAIAALLWQVAPHSVPDAIVAALRAHAIDIAAPGRDREAGDGLIDAEAAVAYLATPLAGDCDGNRRVLVAEVVTSVRIALGKVTLSACPAADADGSGAVGINDLITAVNAALA